MDKLRGGADLPARANLRHIALSWMGGFLAIAVVYSLTEASRTPLVLGSFGASCVLIFGFPESPFSQPRNVIMGHVLSSLIGLACLSAFGASWWSAGLAVGTAIGAMQITRTVHPPAGSNPVIVMLAAPGWSFLLFPTTVGAMALVVVAVSFNNLLRDRAYPRYWVG
ncbi:HPP family protein [Magnetospirillum sp. 15-1]|uniref:HPP family protein n=1 Tax=Magnetospirillum sp. 15-1 TaxID=1979370 RepID=UPI0018D53C84|nr:HPP family protein [Magnetospirillum sp. 15-1]